MKIGLFTDTYMPEINGVAVSTAMLQEELSRRGHDVYIFTTSNPGAKELEERIYRTPSMPLLVLPSRRVGSMINPRLAEQIRNTGLDIAHSMTEFSLGIFCNQIVSSMDIAHVHTYHTIYEEYTHYVARGILDGQKKKAVRALTRKYCNNCDYVITPSEKVRLLLKGYGVTRPIGVIPSGIDTTRFQKEKFDREVVLKLRASMGIGPDNPVLVSIGRISKEKNIQSVLRGLPTFFAKHPEAYFVLVGDGPYVDELRALAGELGISGHVIFAGEKPWAEIGWYYQIGDVFISASTSETQGLTYTEAMSASLIVVAREDPCISGLVDDGETGFLFKGEEEIAPALERAFFEKDLIETIRSKALARAEQCGTSVFGERIENLYLSLIEKRKSREEV